MKAFYAATLSLASSIILAAPGATAQYYPGGLGNSNLKLWLTAADATTLLNPGGAQAASGDYIAKWKDKSGNNNHATQATSGAQPVDQTNALNGNAAVIFQNLSEWLGGPSGAYQTMIAVRNMPGAGHYQYLFSSPANADFSIRGGGAATVYADGPNGNDWTTGTGSPTAQWINGIQSLAGSSANHILVSQAASPTNATYSISNVAPTAAWSGRGMNGNDAVYELLSYNTALTTTQRTILENYEAAGWGLGSLLPTSGYTVFTSPSVSTYNKNLVGIGYTSSTDNVLSTTTGSTDGLGFSSSSAATGFLHTAGFLMAAHNGQSNTTNTSSSVPNIASANPLTVWNRSWYIQKAGGNATGQVTLTFNFSDYNGTTPSGANVYALLYNTANGSFSTTANQLVTTSATVLSGNTVSFTVSAANLPAGYYSIIYSATPITLPIVLTDFSAIAQQGKSLLKWTTSQETGSDNFDIQRATDGVHFSTIGTVTSNGTSALPGYYTYTDNQPAGGSDYYRLKIVDEDGNFVYSDIRSINFTASESVSLSIYPNPATDRLHVTATNSTGTFQILIVDMQGQVVRRANSASSTTADITVNDLSKGVYVLEVNTGDSQFAQKFMKN